MRNRYSRRYPTHTQYWWTHSRNSVMTDSVLSSSSRWDSVTTVLVIQQVTTSLTILTIYSGRFLVWTACRCTATEEVIGRRNILSKISFSYHTGAAPNQQAHAQRNNQGIGFHYLFIVIFLFYAISPLFKSAPYHSFNLDSQYRFKVNSDVLHTQYFVREEFFD